MKITREDVLRVAELAHLELSGDEAEMYRGQLDSVLTYIDKLKTLDVSRAEPMAQVTFNTGLQTQHEHPELRDDALQPCGTAADLFGQAPDAAKPFFRVPKVIDR